MKQRITFFCLLTAMFSCTGVIPSESGLTTITVSSLDSINNTLINKVKVLKSNEKLDYFKITIENKKGSGCSNTITKTENDSDTNIPLQTGSEDSCTYSLTAIYGKNSTPRFKGETSIGPGEKYPYTNDKTINIELKLEDIKTDQTAEVTFGTAITTGTSKNVSISVCYNNECDNNTNTGSNTSNDTCTSKLEEIKNQMSSTPNELCYIYCYPESKCNSIFSTEGYYATSDCKVLPLNCSSSKATHTYTLLFKTKKSDSSRSMMCDTVFERTLSSNLPTKEVTSYVTQFRNGCEKSY